MGREGQLSSGFCLVPASSSHLSVCHTGTQASGGSQIPFPIPLLPHTGQCLRLAFPGWPWAAAVAQANRPLSSAAPGTSSDFTFSAKKDHQFMLQSKKGHVTTLSAKLALRVHSLKCLHEQQPSCCHRSRAQEPVGNHSQKQPLGMDSQSSVRGTGVWRLNKQVDLGGWSQTCHCGRGRLQASKEGRLE